MPTKAAPSPTPLVHNPRKNKPRRMPITNEATDRAASITLWSRPMAAQVATPIAANPQKAVKPFESETSRRSSVPGKRGRYRSLTVDEAEALIAPERVLIVTEKIAA